MKDNSQLFSDIEKYLNNPDKGNDEYILFTEDEYNMLILNFLAGRQDVGADEEEILKIIRWAERVRVDEAFLNLFMQGFVVLDFDEQGEITVQRNERQNYPTP